MIKKTLVKIFHYPSIVLLTCVWWIFTLIAIHQFYNALIHLFHTFDIQFFLEEVFIMFLFIELVAAIKIYFSENYHFPLRFFVYMWITDLIRHVIVSHNDWKETLYFSLAIFVLIICLAIMDYKNKLLLKKIEKENEKSFEI